MRERRERGDREEREREKEKETCFDLLTFARRVEVVG
jgi:hypothetical protein